MERMRRIYFLQQWYGLADEALEDALYDSQALRGFAGIELNRDPVPNATTLLHCRHWLERHDLTRALFDEIGAVLEERGLLMRQCTIVDATIIAAPRSTKNKQKSCDPEMHQTKKGNQWHFGMKAHIGVDVASGVVHTLTGTAANAEPVERALAQLRAPVEHPFHIVKNLFRHKKLRYRGLAKNTAQLHSPVRAGQSGDRQKHPARPGAGLTIPEPASIRRTQARPRILGRSQARAAAENWLGTKPSARLSIVQWFPRPHCLPSTYTRSYSALRRRARFAAARTAAVGLRSRRPNRSSP
jgi:IS5 family transposase